MPKTDVYPEVIETESAPLAIAKLATPEAIMQAYRNSDNVGISRQISPVLAREGTDTQKVDVLARRRTGQGCHSVLWTTSDKSTSMF